MTLSSRSRLRSNWIAGNKLSPGLDILLDCFHRKCIVSSDDWIWHVVWDVENGRNDIDLRIKKTNIENTTFIAKYEVYDDVKAARQQFSHDFQFSEMSDSQGKMNIQKIRI